MKPIIGITVDANADPSDERTRGTLRLNWNYAQAVADAGGVPILIPPMADLVRLATVIDGWLIPGGRDIDASHWGEENHPKVEPIDEARFEAERRLYASAPAEMPILGVCYGCQFLNVVRGGSLIQHLPDVVGHDTHSGGTEERYSIAEDSKLCDMVGRESVRGKSYHHQAIGALGELLVAVAKHEDGTVEAIEATDRPWVIGVQWHPERSLDDPASRALFKHFVEAARLYREAREGVPA